MKTISSLLVLGLLAATALPSMAQQRQRNSPHETVSTVIAGSRVTVTYGRPYAKARKIWGGLVPYGQVWRTGADEATTLITQKPLVFGDVTVPAGAHSLWILPAEDGSAKLIVNKQIGQWGAGPGSYDEGSDVARIGLKKDALDTAVDQFTISVSRNNDTGGVLTFSWENTQYSAPFTVQN